MIEHLRKWLNGNREYWTGTILYDHFGDNNTLKRLFKKSESNFNKKKLNDGLESVWENLQKPVEKKADSTPENTELIAACKLKADKEYKRIMNLRAVLFQLANVKEAVDVNRQI